MTSFRRIDGCALLCVVGRNEKIPTRNVHARQPEKKNQIDRPFFFFLARRRNVPNARGWGGGGI